VISRAIFKGFDSLQRVVVEWMGTGGGSRELLRGRL
jgi:hypothetical protein